MGAGEIIIAIGVIMLMIMWGACIVSGKCSREEEQDQIRKLDPKELDNEQRWEDELVYDDTFVKKGKNNEKK